MIRTETLRHFNPTDLIKKHNKHQFPKILTTEEKENRLVHAVIDYFREGNEKKFQVKSKLYRERSQAKLKTGRES